MSSLADRLSSVQASIADAVHAAGRSADDVTTIVVTKFHPVSLVEELYALGVRDFGENRQQELSLKVKTAEVPEARWHFIGQAQTNKAGAIARAADAVHSVDRIKLAGALQRAATAERSAPLDVLVQLNLTDDPGRGGAQFDELEPLVEEVLSLDALRLRGVMAVAPLDEDPAAAFARVRAASDRIRTLAPDATAISAGMSHDFRQAIDAGATHLRIGSAITGPRPNTA